MQSAVWPLWNGVDRNRAFGRLPIVKGGHATYNHLRSLHALRSGAVTSTGVPLGLATKFWIYKKFKGTNTLKKRVDVTHEWWTAESFQLPTRFSNLGFELDVGESG
jgi:hypothetical protein